MRESVKREVMEVYSFLLRHMNDYVTSTIDELYYYIDNCTRKNKYHALIRFITTLTDSDRLRNWCIGFQ